MTQGISIEYFNTCFPLCMLNFSHIFSAGVLESVTEISNQGRNLHNRFALHLSIVVMFQPYWAFVRVQWNTLSLNTDLRFIMFHPLSVWVETLAKAVCEFLFFGLSHQFVSFFFLLNIWLKTFHFSTVFRDFPQSFFLLLSEFWRCQGQIRNSIRYHSTMPCQQQFCFSK